MAQSRRKSSTESFEHVNMSDLYPNPVRIRNFEGKVEEITFAEVKDMLKFLLLSNVQGLTLEQLQSEWAQDGAVTLVSLKDLAKAFRFPSVDKLMQDKMMEDIVVVEEIVENGQRQFLYSARSSEDVEHITKQMEIPTFNKEQQQLRYKHVRKMTAFLPENKKKLLEGKERILRIAYELGADKQEVSFQKLQERYKQIFYEVALNGDEFKRFFLQRSPKKVFLEVFANELEVRSAPNQDGNLFVKFKLSYNTIQNMLLEQAEKYCEECRIDVPKDEGENLDEVLDVVPVSNKRQFPHNVNLQQAKIAPPPLTTIPPKNLCAPVPKFQSQQAVSHGEKFLRASLSRTNIQERKPNNTIPNDESVMGGARFFSNVDNRYPHPVDDQNFEELDHRNYYHSTPKYGAYQENMPEVMPMAQETPSSMYYQNNYQDGYTSPSRHSLRSQESNYPSGRTPYAQESTSKMSEFDRPEPRHYPPIPVYASASEMYPTHPRRPPTTLNYPFRPTSSMSFTSTISKSTAVPTFEDREPETATPKSTRNLVHLNGYKYDLDEPVGKLAVAISGVIMARTPDLLHISKLPDILQGLMAESYVDAEHGLGLSWLEFIHEYCPCVETLTFGNNRVYLGWKPS